MGVLTNIRHRAGRYRHMALLVLALGSLANCTVFPLNQEKQLHAGIKAEAAGDLTRAEQLYRKASRSRPQYTNIYVPRVGEHAPGTLLMVRSGSPDKPGLAEAKYRLGRLLLARNDGRVEACRWLTQAAMQGYTSAELTEACFQPVANGHLIQGK